MSISNINRLARISDAKLPRIRAKQLVAQLSHEGGSDGTSPAKDARSALALAMEARGALAAGKKKNHRAKVRELRQIAKGYRAKVIDHRDLSGMVVGLAFASGTFKSGHKDWFYLA